jgi:hypothetical protein
MSTVKVNLNGIVELDFPTGVGSASTTAGVTTINFTTVETSFISSQPSGAIPGTTFTLSAPPAFIAAVYVSGQFVPPSQYYVSGSTIVFYTAITGTPWVVYSTDTTLTVESSDVIGLYDFNSYYPESTNTMDAMQFAYSEFTQQAPLTYGAADATSVIYDGKIYVIGGYGVNATTYLTYVQIYDPTTNTWSQGTPITTGEWGAGGAVYNGKIYVFGGATLATGQSGTTLALVYDIAGNSWSALTALPVSMADGVMAVTVGTKIYILWQSSFYEFDPTGSGGMGSYTALTTPPSAAQVEWAATGYINISGDDRIYYIGGSTGSSTGYTNVNYYYSVTSSTWSSAQAVAPYSAHGQLQGAVYNGNIYYLGGYDNTIFYRNLYAYTPSMNTWSASIAALNEWRDGISGGMIGAILYAIGGRNAGNSSAPFGMVSNESYQIGSAPVPQTFTKLQINYNQPSPTGDVRLGVYADNGSSGPGALILDAGAVTIANGWVFATVDMTLNPGTLYWLAFVQNSAEQVSYTGGAPQNILASAAHYYVAQTYGSLPATFPSGGTYTANSMYAMKLTTD